jgi:hypothetical protein
VSHQRPQAHSFGGARDLTVWHAEQHGVGARRFRPLAATPKRPYNLKTGFRKRGRDRGAETPPADDG